MKHIKAPERYDFDGISIFLAGSIEMGKAEPWQDKVAEALADTDITILNPRRDDWDSSWIQSIDNPQFNEQVNWELDHIDIADIVFFYFQPGTISPVSLMELGYAIGINCDVVVVCPEGFHRKGNVDIICRRHGIQLFETIEEGIGALV